MSCRKNWQAAKSIGFSFFNEEYLTGLCEAGIAEIELSSGEINPFYDEGFVAEPERFVSLAEKCGITLSSVHLPFAPFSQIDPSAQDSAVREFAVTKQCEIIKAVAQAGVKLVVIHPSGEPISEESRKDRLQYALGSLGEMVGFAKALGVTVAVENLPRTCLCRTSDEMLWLLDRIPDIRVCFDMNHSLVEDNCHYIKQIGSRIVTVHVSDYDFIDERHMLPGEGLSDWQAIINTLEEVGYEGRFLYELRGDYTAKQIKDNYDNLIQQS